MAKRPRNPAGRDQQHPPDELREAARRDLAAAFDHARYALHKQIEFNSPQATLDRMRKRLEAESN